eukprot:13418038-Ditylum_brightwellii.AAC.1
MLICLASKLRPDISMAVHQCVRYTYNPCCIHEVAVKRIVCYLIGTKDTKEGQTGYHGMVINRTDDLTLECFVDANFAGLWGHEDDQVSSSVKSCTGFILTLGGTLILWVSKLQSEVACSTMEAEYTALAHLMLSTMWEDNNRALALANMPVPHMNPCSKHIGVKYQWLCSWINETSNDIVVQHINSKEQKGNILTKPLGRLEFSDKRKMLMG